MATKWLTARIVMVRANQDQGFRYAQPEPLPTNSCSQFLLAWRPARTHAAPHAVGIGGIGMSASARVTLARVVSLR